MKLHHVGIATDDLNAARQRYRLLGYRLEAEEVLPSQGVRAAMLVSGDDRLELLEPTGPETPVGRFLAKRGPGLHHLAFLSSNVAADLERLANEGARLVDEQPRPGFGGHLVAFVHPSWSGGVLVELVEAER
ncbi:methylmalonyl-CoA epimerase [Oceanithermus sp.]